MKSANFTVCLPFPAIKAFTGNFAVRTTWYMCLDIPMHGSQPEKYDVPGVPQRQCCVIYIYCSHYAERLPNPRLLIQLLDSERESEQVGHDNAYLHPRARSFITLLIPVQQNNSTVRYPIECSSYESPATLERSSVAELSTINFITLDMKSRKNG